MGSWIAAVSLCREMALDESSREDNNWIVIQTFTFQYIMAYIKRYLKEEIVRNLEKRKIVLVYGARQVGKTTVAREFLSEKGEARYLNGDFSDDCAVLDGVSRTMVDRFSDTKLLIVDEAQNVPEIGKKLKAIHDTLPDVRILATGSSSFELSGKVVEPLTGRNVTLTMFPLSLGETGIRDPERLEDILLYGTYPEVHLQVTREEKRAVIARIAESYLFKDVLNISSIRNPKSMERLVRIMAAQVGNEVSFHELANTLDLDVKTVMAYVDMLEKLFIVFPLLPFASNVRKSVTKKRRYYFYDLGIRNAVLADFSSLENRKDVGALWENFVVVERMKKNLTEGRMPKYLFFRSYKGEEIDLLEKYDDRLLGFECKYSKGECSKKISRIFSEDLGGDGELSVVNRRNFPDYLIAS